MNFLSTLLFTCLFCTALSAQDNHKTIDYREITTPLHISGKVVTPDGQPIGNVAVSIQPGNILATLTQSNGSFDFVLDLEENTMYQLYLEREYSPLEGITPSHVLQIVQIILGGMQIDSPYQLIAADINNDGVVTVSDLIQLKKLMLGLSDPPGIKAWRFVKAGCNPVADPVACPLDFVETFTTGSTMTGLQIIGIKTGVAGN